MKDQSELPATFLSLRRLPLPRRCPTKPMYQGNIQRVGESRFGRGDDFSCTRQGPTCPFRMGHELPHGNPSETRAAIQSCSLFPPRRCDRDQTQSQCINTVSRPVRSPTSRVKGAFVRTATQATPQSWMNPCSTTYVRSSTNIPTRVVNLSTK